MDRTVLLAVDEATSALTGDDAVLAAALDARGIRSAPVVWGRPVTAGATVVIRSTWDYIERPAAFAAWLDRLDAVGAVVHNPTSLLRWNLHKGYLVELDRRGVAVVPTVVVRRGHRTSLDEVLARHGWRDVVIKPAVGATAWRTEHAGAIGGPAASAHLAQLVETGDAVVQPFVESITTTGEVSVVVIGGRPLLAVLKRAATGDWRVQSDYGGSVAVVELTAELRRAALAAVGALRPVPTYARVDLVRDEHDALRVLELELVEPELFFRLDTATAAHLAALVVARR
jgi:glutathione synthase/RimK-type ligase-like ATP-grasp enzyme